MPLNLLTERNFMKLGLFTNLISVALVLSGSSASLAGGGRVGPVITYIELVQCRTIDPNETQIQSLTYFVRTEGQFGFSSQRAGVYLEGKHIAATIYSFDGDIHDIQSSQSAPVSVTPERQTFYTLGGNVRALAIVAKGLDVSLSIVAGATADIVTNNLKMHCFVP